jgi:hypothetical protein
VKNLTLILALLVTVVFSGRAQNTQKQLPASIFIIDAKTGAQVEAISDAAVSFKNALIALVVNTPTAKLQQAMKIAPGKRSFMISQLDPNSNGNAYQLILQRTFLGQANVVYTFMYNFDQNKLFFSDPNTGSWVEQIIQPINISNLNDCHTFGGFNAQATAAAAPDNAAAGPAPDQDAPVDSANLTAPAPPPAIPDYEQPACPQDGYLWQPGYWAYSVPNANYYWVPGVWLAPPTVGYLWTPPYWAFANGVYAFNAGYWGANMGFYGGIDYGFGYGGVGFVGGEWRNGYFAYNTAVLRVGFNTHTYVDARYNGRIVNHYAFNGRGGAMARPNEHELAAMHDRHIMATAEQNRNQRAAMTDKRQFAGPGGKPANLSTARPPARGQIGPPRGRVIPPPVKSKTVIPNSKKH